MNAEEFEEAASKIRVKHTEKSAVEPGPIYDVPRRDDSSVSPFIPIMQQPAISIPAATGTLPDHSAATVEQFNRRTALAAAARIVGERGSVPETLEAADQMTRWLNSDSAALAEVEKKLELANRVADQQRDAIHEIRSMTDAGPVEALVPAVRRLAEKANLAEAHKATADGSQEVLNLLRRKLDLAPGENLTAAVQRLLDQHQGVVDLFSVSPGVDIVWLVDQNLKQLSQQRDATASHDGEIRALREYIDELKQTLSLPERASLKSAVEDLVKRAGTEIEESSAERLRNVLGLRDGETLIAGSRRIAQESRGWKGNYESLQQKCLSRDKEIRDLVGAQDEIECDHGCHREEAQPTVDAVRRVVEKLMELWPRDSPEDLSPSTILYNVQHEDKDSE